ncbi:MAG: AAA family ATPase [Bacteroidales bacterium]|nr:AAA family ATPase [Bacteroidales bacterium]
MSHLPNVSPSLPLTRTPTPPQNSTEIQTVLLRLRENIASVFLGKPDVIRLAVIALVADGHLLLEDVPGVGKTLLGKAIAKSLGCGFQRIQFTPDLLPGDLTGTSVFQQDRGTFTFQPGPVFTQVLLADEINRATLRTQSALLEAMSERQVTVDGVTRPLGPPYLVLATQNPYEFEGTYPLPESQLDRFLLRVKVGYPNRAAERAILTQHRVGEPIDQLASVLTPEDVLAVQAAARAVRVEESLTDYLLAIVEASRQHPQIVLGASTRAALAYYRAAQAAALTDGRDYVTPDDVKALAHPVLTHRLITRGWDQGQHHDADTLVDDILHKVPALV